MTAPDSPLELVATIAQPTRLRILNCLAAAPLFVSDLQDILDVPQPTVSQHLNVLKKAQLVKDTPIAPYVLYQLQREAGALGRMVRALLDLLVQEEALRRERAAALDRSRTRGRAGSQ
ncbi:MAG: metalloregulator ArsR/SmtB family transcription factor [Gemmatimonadota bacterium]